MPLSNEQFLERLNAHTSPTGILFGTRVLEVDQDAKRVRLSFDIGPQFCNPRGKVQGGILSALLDEAAAHAGIISMGEAGFIVSLEFKTSFFAPASHGTLFAEARCLKMGRSTCFLEADLSDGNGILLARFSSSAVPVRTKDKPILVETGR